MDTGSTRSFAITAPLLLFLAASASAQSPARSGDEVRSLVAQMTADAETRSSLLAEGAAAGHNGKNFFLQSSDGTFRLVVRGQIQFRYYLDFRDNNDSNTDGFAEDDFESGFQARRTKLYFQGHAWDPALTYQVNGAFSRATGDWRLEDAYAAYKLGGGFSILWGAFKLPFLREETTSASAQLAVERSIVNDAFSLVRSQGVQLSYENEDFRLALAFSDGAASDSSEFGSPRRVTASGLLNRSGNGESDYAVTLRAEYKPFGKWDAFKDFTSPRGADYALMLGVAGHVEGGEADSSTFTVGEYRYSSWTADITAEGDGWNCSLAGVGGYADFRDSLVGDDANDDYGVVAQGGFLIGETDWEPFVRYAGLFTDDDRSPGDDDVFSSLTLGVNYYLYGHASKFSFDVIWYIDESDPLVVSRLGHGQLGDDDDGEVTVRVQWQLLF